jgi:hypothetical protein
MDNITNSRIELDTNILNGISGIALEKKAITTSINNSKLYSESGKKLSKLNSMRGGIKGQKGFVFEELHATKATISGQPTIVINNNGIADFAIQQSNGSIKYGQAKIGYTNQTIDFSPYKDQVIIIDKGNNYLIEQAKKQGQKYIESEVGIRDAEFLSKIRQMESKVTGNTGSPIICKSHAVANVVKESHKAGVKAGKAAAAAGLGFSVGSNLVDVVTGDKNIGEAGKEVAKDTAIAAGVGYAATATVSAIGSTAAGAATITAISGAVGTATAAVTSTAAGAAVLGASTAAVGAIGAVGTAAATTAVSAVASAGVAVGGAAIGTAIAGSAIAGVAIAAAPVVAVAAVAGVGYKVFKKIFGR